MGSDLPNSALPPAMWLQLYERGSEEAHPDLPQQVKPAQAALVLLAVNAAWSSLFCTDTDIC